MLIGLSFLSVISSCSIRDISDLDKFMERITAENYRDRKLKSSESKLLISPKTCLLNVIGLFINAVLYLMILSREILKLLFLLERGLIIFMTNWPHFLVNLLFSRPGKMRSIQYSSWWGDIVEAWNDTYISGRRICFLLRFSVSAN